MKCEMFFSCFSLALSIWSTYQQINACQVMTNDMQQTAIDMANKENDVERIKLQKVDPLLSNVTNEVNMLRIYWWLLVPIERTPPSFFSRRPMQIRHFFAVLYLMLNDVKNLRDVKTIFKNI